jgi:AcrR family transcriptional regulator
MKTVDKRIQRTRARLKDALINLVIECGYEDITIQDVSARAGIGYRTFFRHYNGLDDLLVTILKEQSTEIQNRMVHPSTYLAPEHNGRLLFEYVQKNRVLFLVMVRSHFIRDMLPELKENVLSTFGDTFPPNTPYNDLVSHHIITSILSLIGWWLEDDNPPPPDEMGRLYARLIMYPARRLLESGADDLPPTQPDSNMLE